MFHHQVSAPLLLQNVDDLRQMPVLQALHHLQLMTEGSAVRILFQPDFLDCPEHLRLQMDRQEHAALAPLSQTPYQSVLPGKNPSYLHPAPPGTNSALPFSKKTKETHAK